MTDFKLDTSGAVIMRQHVPASGERISPVAYCWSDLSPFVQGYIEEALKGLRSTDPAAIKALERMRGIDRPEGNRPLLCSQRKALHTTVHWSRTHQWPGVCDDLALIGLVKIVAKVDGGYVTEPTDLGRAVLTLMLGFSDLAPETLARFMEDCERVLSARSVHPADTNHTEGRNFWSLRQDGYYRPEQLEPLTLYLADDGKVHHREAGR